MSFPTSNNVNNVNVNSLLSLSDFPANTTGPTTSVETAAARSLYIKSELQTEIQDQTRQANDLNDQRQIAEANGDTETVEQIKNQAAALQVSVSKNLMDLQIITNISERLNNSITTDDAQALKDYNDYANSH